MPSAFGVYRGVYTSLVDDPEFQQLSSQARHVFQTMRISREIGPACIWRAYLGPIAQRTGYTVAIVKKALADLVSGEWIEWDGVIIWIKNGLRYDPTFKLSDVKHQTSVLNSISSLPKRNIVLNFCNYYDLPCPFDAPSKTLTRSAPPNPNPSTKSEPPIAPHGGFDQFWEAYPRKVGKGAARTVWEKITPTESLLNKMLTTLSWQRLSEQWTKDRGAFIPHPSTWLNQQRWEDEPAKDSRPEMADSKLKWKDRTQYLDALKAGRVSPKERVPEWEQTIDRK